MSHVRIMFMYTLYGYTTAFLFWVLELRVGSLYRYTDIDILLQLEVQVALLVSIVMLMAVE